MMRIGLFLFLFWGTVLFANTSKEVTLTILSVNDVYEELPKEQGLGGFAELATLLEKERAKSEYSITTVNGDFLSPSLLSTHFKGKQMVKFFDALGVELVVFGNHEFDFGAQNLRDCMDLSHFTWLGTNVLESNGELFHTAKASVLKEFGGVKVGFFGVCLRETKELSRGGNEVLFAPEEERARLAIKELKRQGAEVIIALTHMTKEQDRSLARNVAGIDVILGGHEHTYMTFQEGKTLIHKSGHDAEYLVKMDLHIERKENLESKESFVVVTPEWHMIPNRKQVPSQKLAGMIEQFHETLDQELAISLVRSRTPLCSHSSCMRRQETAFGNLVTDAIKDYMGVDAVILNGGTIRGERNYAPSQVLTKKDLLRELPFANGCRALKMKGKELVEALERGVAGREELKGGFPQVSGLSFSLGKQEGVWKIKELFIAGREFEEEKEYIVGVSDYMAFGGDGYVNLAGLPQVKEYETDEVLYSLVSSYLEKKGEVAPTVEGRIRFEGTL